MQAGLALYWWQRLITFGVDRIRVKKFDMVWVNKFGFVVTDLRVLYMRENINKSVKNVTKNTRCRTFYSDGVMVAFSQVQ